MSNDVKTDKDSVHDPIEKSTEEPRQLRGSRPGPDLTGCAVEIRRVYPDKKS